jgi:signal transduction histidine kinase
VAVPGDGNGAVETVDATVRTVSDGATDTGPTGEARGPFVSSFSRHGESGPAEYSLDVSRLRADGSVQGYALVIRDVTERRRRIQEPERQKAQLERFASTLSHDLRNPLNVAEGRTELALETGDLDHLRTVADAHERIHGVIDDLLTLSREGRTIDDPEPVALVDAAEDAWETTDTANATFQAAPAADVRVYADRTRLLNVFENVFRNSVEHGGPDVAIRLVGHPGGGVRRR